MKNHLVVVITGLLIIPGTIFAADQKVVINEIAWMGTTNSASDEWIELYNPGPLPINLAGWKLQSADAKMKVALKGIIESQGYYLLERTDNNSVPNIAANIIYKGSLSNSGGHLLLYDNNGAIVDDVNFPNQWPAGSSVTKQTMEKTANGWQTSLHANGTPKAANSIKPAKPATSTATPAITVVPLSKAQKSGNSDSVAAVSAASSVSSLPTQV